MTYGHVCCLWPLVFNSFQQGLTKALFACPFVRQVLQHTPERDVFL